MKKKILNIIKKAKKHYKKTIILLILLIVVSSVLYNYFLKEKESPFSFSIAEVGDLAQEVSVIGQVRKGEKINLSFKETGEVEEIYVKAGDVVEEGQKLVKLKITQLYFQLEEARSSLVLAEAEFNKLIAGSTEEEVKVAQTKVDNALIACQNAEQNLADVKQVAEDDLLSAYEDALNTLESAYLESYNAFNRADSIQLNYFTGNDTQSTDVKEARNIIEVEKDKIKTALDSAKASEKNEDIDTALEEIKDSLDEIYDNLSIIRIVCDDPSYRNDVPSTEKTNLDNNKSNINSALADVTNDQQTISSTRLSNQSSINTAEATLLTAEGELEATEDNLALVLADPRSEDIDLKRAQVNKARASVAILESKISDSVLKSPVAGQISKIEKEIGEQVSLGELVVALLPQEPFQIKVDIPESDIGKVNIGDMSEVVLDAFPEEEFKGKVIYIDPAETVISGVVYYETKVSLEMEDNRIKPGMTANVVIITDFKENVLTVPARAVIEKEGRKIVRRMTNDEEYEEVSVETGLRGTDGKIEIISGLKEGDKVITFIKK